MVDIIHEGFLERLRESHGAVKSVAWYLVGLGYVVRVPETREAPRRSLWAGYSDSGDILASRPGEAPLRIEVKGLTAQFTGRHDWPFGDDFIVNGVGTHDRAKPKPHGYFIVSRDKVHVAYLGTATDTEDNPWEIRSQWDRNTRGRCLFYYANPDLAIWFNLEDCHDQRNPMEESVAEVCV